jgi:hypothetical protein
MKNQIISSPAALTEVLVQQNVSSIGPTKAGNLVIEPEWLEWRK